MGSCVAFNCTNRCSKKIPGLTFHSFPKDETRKQLWIKAVRRENWTPSKFSKLCSKHFPEEMIDRTSLSCVRIRENAVPSIFDFPLHLQKMAKPRKLPTRAAIEPTYPNSQVHSATTEVQPAATELQVASSSSESPTKATYKRKVTELADIVEEKNKKIKVLQQKVRRYEKKVKNLTELLAHLKTNNFLDDDALHVLSTVTAANKEFLSRQLATVTKSPLPQSYSPELRSFALTLNFYSPRAYEYVRSTFGLALPHQKTLSRWYQHIDGAPGFTKEAIEALSLKIKNSPHPLFFSLIMDEMSIRQQAEFDGREIHGLINLGFDEINDDSLPLAKEAFVLLLVCVNKHWKLPIGYFLSDGLNSTKKQTIIKHSLSLLHEHNVKVVSLTFDGLSSNFTMAKQLGCNFDDVNTLKTSFPHPNDSKAEIAIFPDPPHMLKLVRNTFGEKKSLFSSEIIDWKYVEALHKLQEEEGLHLGNKLRGGHIKFSKQKMKIKLAAQLFSSSVADAIDYCNHKLKLPDFEGSEATVEFLRLMNNLFDILNSRSIQQYGFKKAVSKKNKALYFEFMLKAKNYILSLRESRGGLSILESRRKTGFIGFLICIQSFETIVNKMISPECPDLFYFPMYKVSQDHVELLFSSVRFHGGSNDNPTARQFRSAYRKLLVNSEIKATESGNCIALTDVKTLTVSSVSSKKIINITTQCTSMVEHTDEKLGEESLPCIYLTECASDIIYYIAGFIVKKLSSALKCSPCISALFPQNAPTSLSLVSYKSEGKLIHPSNDVFSICKECELVFRQELLTNESKNAKFTVMRKAPDVLYKIQSRNYFEVLIQHQFDTEPTENHLVHLMRCIIFQYFKVRLSHYCKNLSINKESVRQFFKHVVNFKGQ